MKKILSQSELLLEYFYAHPLKNISHPEIVDWVTQEHFKRTWKVFRDPDRWIRKLSQSWILIKVAKWVYKYDPEYIKTRELFDFTPEQKKKILQRDGYRCVICWRGKENWIELQVDHIKPKDLWGENTIENGQTLCAQHNFQKKNYKQTETGKKMFIRLHDLALKNSDTVLISFTEDILKMFEKHDINWHIEWRKADGKTKRIHDKE